MPRGPKGKLTPELADQIVELMGKVASYRIVAAFCHISLESLISWLKRGKAEENTVYSDLYQRAMMARAQCEATCLRTLRNAVTGGWFPIPIRDKHGNFVAQQDPVTGAVVRDEKGNPEVEMKLEYREPDAKLAWQLLARINPSEFGQLRPNRRPDPQAELEKAPSEVPSLQPGKPSTTSLLARAVAYLGDQGVPIPGMVKAPLPKDDVAGDVQPTKDSSAESKPGEKDPGE